MSKMGLCTTCAAIVAPKDESLTYRILSLKISITILICALQRHAKIGYLTLIEFEFAARLNQRQRKSHEEI